MTKLQRIENIALGIFAILLSVVMIRLPNEGFYIAALILCLTLLTMGVRSLLYYFTMARHMVGGKAVLFRGVIVLDLAFFTLTLNDIPRIYLILYLLSYHAFFGVVDVLRALEARQFEAPGWKLNMGYGLVNIGIAVACGFFIRSVEMIVYVYAVGLIYSGVERIITSFRRTAVVYIQ